MLVRYPNPRTLSSPATHSTHPTHASHPHPRQEAVQLLGSGPAWSRQSPVGPAPHVPPGAERPSAVEQGGDSDTNSDSGPGAGSWALNSRAVDWVPSVACREGAMALSGALQRAGDLYARLRESHPLAAASVSVGALEGVRGGGRVGGGGEGADEAGGDGAAGGDEEGGEGVDDGAGGDEDVKEAGDVSGGHEGGGTGDGDDGAADGSEGGGDGGDGGADESEGAADGGEGACGGDGTVGEGMGSEEHSGGDGAEKNAVEESS